MACHLLRRLPLARLLALPIHALASLGRSERAARSLRASGITPLRASGTTGDDALAAVLAGFRALTIARALRHFGGALLGVLGFALFGLDALASRVRHRGHKNVLRWVPVE